MSKSFSVVIVRQEVEGWIASLRFDNIKLDCNIANTSKYMLYNNIERYLKDVRAV